MVVFAAGSAPPLTGAPTADAPGRPAVPEHRAESETVPWRCPGKTWSTSSSSPRSSARATTRPRWMTSSTRSWRSSSA
ncbi:hypothetical protein MICRO11B_220056 [Micrococcus luteus]|nr:hypothetical protein MICRO11B_220056 [Micrococcus luteus]